MFWNNKQFTYTTNPEGALQAAGAWGSSPPKPPCAHWMGGRAHGEQAEAPLPPLLRVPPSLLAKPRLLKKSHAIGAGKRGGRDRRSRGGTAARRSMAACSRRPVNRRQKPPANAVSAWPAAALCPRAAQSVFFASRSWRSPAGRMLAWKGQKECRRAPCTSERRGRGEERQLEGTYNHHPVHPPDQFRCAPSTHTGVPYIHSCALYMQVCPIHTALLICAAGQGVAFCLRVTLLREGAVCR